MSIIELPDETECVHQGVFSEIKSLPFVTPGEWTGGTLPGLCRDELLHEIFERQAARTPENVAVIDGAREVTYRELDRLSNQLAHLLRSYGIGRGSFVGILVGRSIEAYIAILGCLKSGAAYVPLDPAYPAERVAFILADCGVELLLVSRSGNPSPAGFEGPVIAVEDTSRGIRENSVRPQKEIHENSVPRGRGIRENSATGADDDPNAHEFSYAPDDLNSHEFSDARDDAEPLSRRDTHLTPHDLCYVIYTSGSTGKPKGVEIEHRSAAHLVRAEQWLYGVRSDDRVYQGFSLAFDASVEEVWMAFSTGATLMTATPEMSHAGPGLSALLEEAQVTVVSCVPTLLAMLTDDISTLRLLIVGGEACGDDLVRRWCRPGRRMVNTYGPTEATVIATFADCDPDRPVTIGRPLPNYTAFVLDDKLRPVENGQTGELYLGGVGLARGYVGRPELTRERFVVNPFHGGGAASRLYKTGDLARFDAHGNIEFHGRVDLQVKLRGFRVELSEIESALLKCLGVQAAACVVHELSPGLSHLVAYVVPNRGEAVAADRIRAELRTELPAYMIPTIIEPIDELPTLSSGKVDRKRLPVPQLTTDASPVDTTSLTNGQRKLLGIWQGLFLPMPVNLTDDFFLDLGGHSLLAARMVSELRKDRQFSRISMLDVYNDPTIEKLAARFADVSQVVPEAVNAGQPVPDAVDPVGVLSPRQPLFRQAQTDLPPRRQFSIFNFQFAFFNNVLRREDSPVEATNCKLKIEKCKLQIDEPRLSPSPARRHFLCGLAQAIALYFILGVFALQWLAPYLAYTWMIEMDFIYAEAALAGLGSLVILYPMMLALALIVKWTVIGKYKAGRYPLWGVYYFRWWFVNAVQSIVPIEYLAGTPLLGLYYRLLGARIGTNVHLGTHLATAFDLVSIGDDSSVGTDAAILAHTVRDGHLILEPVSLGERCCVGNRSVVAGGARLENDSRLAELSLLPAGNTIPSGQTWHGSPARRAAISALAPDRIARPGWARRFAFGALHSLGILIVPVFVICAIFPGMMVMHYLNMIDDYYYYLVLAPLVAVSFVVFLCLEIAAFKWLVLGRVRPGRYSLFSGFYLRKRFVDQLMELSLDVLSPLYSTIYLAPWYRMLGAKLGMRAEISTASFISPDLLSIDDEGFIADCVSLGAGQVEQNSLTIGHTHVGRRSFIGNSAVLPPGSIIGDNCLIGCLSSPPPRGQAARHGTSWLGSPGFHLPQRQQHGDRFSEETTFNPTPKLRIQRAAIEFFRVIGPSTGFIILTSLLLSAVILIRDAHSDAHWLLLFPLLYAACGIASCAIVIALKWILIGKFRPGEKPLWSTFVWRNELVTAMHENLSDPFLVDKLRGTPFVAWFFRLLGAKIGKRAHIDTTCFTEYDLVDIGDDVALNNNATVQTHLFEDRVMKMSEIHIADGCSVGVQSLVLYDTTMERGSSLGDLSLLMKNEQLPAGTAWAGIPARPVDMATASA